MKESMPSIPPAVLDRLLEAGSEAWDEFRALANERFHLFIPCDHRGAYEALRKLRAHAVTFVELGSASGVVTIMADMLGFEAFGIEIEPWLVNRAVDLAEEFGSSAVFAEGSFVSPDYVDELENLSAEFHTPIDGADGFDELGIELSECDLVFAYPWPGEEDWLREMVRRFGRPDTLLLTYDVREGFRLSDPECDYLRD